MGFKLRDYQKDLDQRTREELRHHQRVCMQLATGGGKTVIFNHMAAGAAKNKHRTLILVHRSFLLKQTCKALAKQGVPYGVIAPGVPMTNDLVQVAMVQTLAIRIKKGHPIPKPALLVVDECHHSPADSWATILDWLGAAGKVVGVTATPNRRDGRGLGDQYEVMVQGPPIKWLQTNINPDTGLTYLSPYLYLAPKPVVDLSKLRSEDSDYSCTQAELLLMNPKVTGDAIDHYKKYGKDMPAVAFCVTIKHAKEVAKQFREAGIPAEHIDGTMDEPERERLIKALETGKIKVLTSCNLISEGFDLPKIGVVILLRPTQSEPLFMQMVGRSLRPFEGKEYAVIQDHVANCIMHGMPDDERNYSLDSPRRKRGGRKKALEEGRVKQCPECYAAFAPSYKSCPLCGYVFPIKDRVPEQVEGELVEIRSDQVAAVQVNTLDAERKKSLGRAKTLEELYAVCDENRMPRGIAENVYKQRLKKMGLNVAACNAALQKAIAKIEREKQEKHQALQDFYQKAENLGMGRDWAENEFSKVHGKHGLKKARAVITKPKFEKAV